MYKRLKHKNVISRLKRKVFAEWQQIDMSNPDLIQLVTDAMTYGYPVQVNYDGSGWRTIQPYGWNTSKEGNVLLMCYKDTGEVRSYRLDKILDLYIDEGNQISTNNNPQMSDDQQMDIYEDIMNGQGNGIDMPEVPGEEDNTQPQSGVYDNELSLLTNNPQEVVNNDEVIDNNNQYNNNSNEEVNNESEEKENEGNL